MRSRSELYDILVDELRIDKAKATEIIDNAFAVHDDETKKRNEKIEELKEKFVGKLLYIDFDECFWYNGIQRGLQDALQVIGMLDNEHNRLKSSLPTSYPSGVNAQRVYRNKYDDSLI